MHWAGFMRRAVVVVALVSLVGCSKTKSQGEASSVQTTTQAVNIPANVGLGDGYDRNTQTARTGCFDWDVDFTPKNEFVGSAFVISDKTDITTKLKASADVKLPFQYFPLNIGASIEQELKSSSTNNVLVILAAYESAEWFVKNPSLRECGSHEDLKSFAGRCGVEYVKSQSYGGYVGMIADTSSLNITDMNRLRDALADLQPRNQVASLESTLAALSNAGFSNMNLIVFMDGIAGPGGANSSGPFTLSTIVGWMSDTVSKGIDAANNGKRFGGVLYSSLENYRVSDINQCLTNPLSLEQKEWDCIWRSFDDLSAQASGVDSRFADGPNWHRFEVLEAEANRYQEISQNGGFTIFGQSPQEYCREDLDGNPDFENCGQSLHQDFSARWRECRAAATSLSRNCLDAITELSVSCSDLGPCQSSPTCSFDSLTEGANRLPPAQVVSATNPSTAPTFLDFGPFVGGGNSSMQSLGVTTADHICVPSELRGRFDGRSEAYLSVLNGMWTVNFRGPWWATAARDRTSITVRCVPLSSFIHQVGESMNVSSDLITCGAGSCVRPLGSFPPPPALPPVGMLTGIAGHWDLDANDAFIEYSPQSGATMRIETLFDFEVRQMNAVSVERTPSSLTTLLPVLDGVRVSSIPTATEPLAFADLRVSPDDGFCYPIRAGSKLRDASMDFISMSISTGPDGRPTWVLGVNGGLDSPTVRRKVIGGAQCVRWQ